MLRQPVTHCKGARVRDMLLFLCAVFVLSGAAGLIYESVWVRYLGLFVGHGAYAQVLVLVIFLGGMSAGALAAGRRTRGLAEPLRWYAYIERAVGLLGLVFHDVFVWTTQLAYDSIFPALGPGIAHSIAKCMLAALLILIHGLAAWDFAKAVRASAVPLPLAERGDHCLSPNLLREGTVAAHLRTGDATGARAALVRLRGSPDRGRGDMRAELLTTSVAAAEAVRRPVVQR
jgi:hypothetical protein